MPKYKVHMKLEDGNGPEIECDRMVFNQFGHVLFLKKPAIIDTAANPDQMILLFAFKEFMSVENLDGKVDA